MKDQLARCFLKFFAVFVLAALAAAPLSGQERRTALVIGNGAYRASPLRNPPNDATDMAAALRATGFNVSLLTDAGRAAMEKAIRDFGSALKAGGVGLFYYAGHGVQVRGNNYLIPVDQDIQGADEVAYKAVDVGQVLAKMESAENSANIIVLDACRNNPFPGSERSSSRGLSVVGSQPAGSIIVFATAPGTTAQDGRDRNGIFTKHLLNHMRTPDLDVEIMLRRVRDDVKKETDGVQVPWNNSSLSGEGFVFVRGGGQRPAASPPLTARPAPQPAPQPAVAARASEGMVLVEGGTFSMGDTFGDGDKDEKPTHSVTVSGFYMARTEVTVGEFRRFVQETGYKTTAETSGGGRVWTGSKWEQKADANWRNPYFNQTDEHPVVLVSWYDGVEYCNWRSRKEGLPPAYSGSGNNTRCDFSANGYRHPTEAEWEYAAKGGRRSNGYKYAGANDPVSIAWYNANSGNATHAVGGKQANELGLYDMTGNVWEWSWDWYGDYASSAQTDPRGPSAGSNRVVRGGCWDNSADNLRSSYRLIYDPAGSSPDRLGFRPVRTQ